VRWVRVIRGRVAVIGERRGWLPEAGAPVPAYRRVPVV
jgi:hypothetical protein